MKTKPTTTEETRNSQKRKQIGFQKRGCQESLFERNKQTLRKEKARKRKRKKPKTLMFSKKLLMDNKNIKMDC